jgi:hypothetical protein
MARFLVKSHTFGAAVGIAAIFTTTQPSLVAERDHVHTVETFDISASGRDPVVDYVAIASVTTQLIAPLQENIADEDL